MKNISVPNIEEAISNLLRHGKMCSEDIRELVLLGQAMEYAGHADREFTEADAKEWVSHMNPPARWSIDQTNTVMKQHGYRYKPCVFYAVMNMLWSDYGKTVARHGMDTVDFWAEMAHDFIDDIDAEDMKVGRYWRDIVKR